MATRREFLGCSLTTTAALALGAASPRSAAIPAAGRGVGRLPLRPLFPDPRHGLHGESSVAASLRAVAPPASASIQAVPFPAPSTIAPPQISPALADVPGGLLFEYYPWYASDPYRHWEQWDRVPPHDIAAQHMPLLGAYDSRSAIVIEQHARWMAEARVAGISLSWWGRDSFEDRAVTLIMDIMRAHGLKVAFHLEPYAPDRALRWSEDVLYLLRQYGERRRFDALLLLSHSGGVGPVFKGFRTILPEYVRDCHGEIRRVADYAPDTLWRRQNLGLKRLLASDFDCLTFLADSLDFERVVAAGFDGIAIYDNFVLPSSYPTHATGASARGLLFSFNANPGYDGIEPRTIEPGSCYSPTPLEPPAPGVDWLRAAHREWAASLQAERVRESLQATLAVQTDPALGNAQRGFFLAYLNSWNEWHEGHAFEPMKPWADLVPEERQVGYHNPAEGDHRLQALTDALRTPATAQSRSA